MMCGHVFIIGSFTRYAAWGRLSCVCVYQMGLVVDHRVSYESLWLFVLGWDNQLLSVVPCSILGRFCYVGLWCYLRWVGITTTSKRGSVGVSIWYNEKRRQNGGVGLGSVACRFSKTQNLVPFEFYYYYYHYLNSICQGYLPLYGNYRAQGKVAALYLFP